VLDRIDTVQGLSPGAPQQPESELWIKPFGNRLSQDSRDDLPGYDISGGGLVLGFDRGVSTTTTLGGMLAYASNQITGADDAATDSLTLNSVQFGLYGTTWLDRATELNGQIDGAATTNSGLRGIDFLPSFATSDYDSRTAHIGIGLRRIIPTTADRQMIPSLRIDYARVDTESYTESGAGSLDLTVGAQTYEELRLTAGIRGDVRLTDGLRLSVDGAAGYNVLDTQTQITATYAGGGDSFVSTGEDVSPWLFSLGIGVVSLTQGGTDVALRYDLQASPTGYLSQTASIRFTLTF
jgi:outer membrane autotransporter protein